MNKKIIFVALCSLLLAPCFAVEAQQPAKVHRIGVLSGGFPRSSPDIEALRQGLRDLGYVEGKNLVIEYRYAEANAIGTLTFSPTSSTSKLTLLSAMALDRPLLRRKQPAQSPLS